MRPELAIKTERVTEMLDRERLGGVLLNSQHNFAWITGGESNGIDLSRENGAASIFIRNDGKGFLIANNIEVPRMLAEEVSASEFEPVKIGWQDEKASGRSIIELANKLTDRPIATDIPVDAATKSIEGHIANLRYALTDNELIRIRELGRDAGRAMRAVFDRIVPGETELEIASKMRAELGATSIASVVTLVAADERIAKFRHPVPTDKPWEKTILLVTCAKRHGLIVSLSRLAAIGEPDAELIERTEAAAYVNAKLCAATRPGVTGAELYETAAGAYAETGFADEIDKHHQGGAAGYKTREWVAHPASAERVVDRQAFAWNPSITGTKVEETIVIEGESFENITASPDFPTLSLTLAGREFTAPGILNIN